MMSRHLLILLLPIAASLIACGDDTAPPAGPEGGGQHVGAAGGGGAADAGTTTGTTTSGTPEGGGGSGGGPLEGAPECGGLEARIEGEVDGTPLSVEVVPFGTALSGGVQIEFGEYGQLFLLTDEEPQIGSVLATSGFLRMPEDGALPGTWVCAGEGSELLLYNDLASSSAVLRNLSVLGSCPGEPVAGAMDVCFEDGGCGTAGVASTADGATFDAPANGFGGIGGEIGGTEVAVSMTIGLAGGLVVFQATQIDPETSGPQTSELGIGYVIVPEGLEDAGAIYCVGPGSTLEYEMAEFGVTPRTATLTGLSRLGACPANPAEGEIGFCMNILRDR